MSYIIHKSDGTAITVADNNADISLYTGSLPPAIGTGTLLIGRNYINYGAPIAQNFLQLTENFSSGTIPDDTKALQGQLWFNKSSSTAGNLYVRKTGTQSGGITNWNKIVVEDTSGNVSITGTLTAPSFIGNASSATNLVGGSAGTVVYQSATNTTAFVATGSAGQVLTSNGTSAPTWQTAVAPAYTPTINPVGTPKAGDIKVVGSVISIYAAGAWQQVFPAIYS